MRAAAWGALLGAFILVLPGCISLQDTSPATEKRAKELGFLRSDVPKGRAYHDGGVPEPLEREDWVIDEDPVWPGYREGYVTGLRWTGSDSQVTLWSFVHVFNTSAQAQTYYRHERSWCEHAEGHTKPDLGTEACRYVRGWPEGDAEHARTHLNIRKGNVVWTLRQDGPREIMPLEKAGALLVGRY